MTHSTFLSSTPPAWYCDYERGYRAWYGWKPVTGHRCPRFAVGQVCLGDARCICRVYRGLLAYPTVWIDPRGRRVFTADPFVADDVELSAFVSDATAIGLSVVVNVRTGMSPGRVVLLEVRDASSCTPWRGRCS